ncbi:phospholipase D family protein [Calycomorphotria hydatis]|uniref:Phospholipase D-like domain-containing protein n=1 Tax=Calycomorphotria hydatis TaxID=2528027 RepID=A0A517T6X5_9PLAN|nr:phospholipase D family protein [Calycomorphotria hydatis]QDT64110.1 hypothetical protein V22_13410 [Calycomorphotria hydatis]
MAKFLNTSATNYFLEELIKSAQERLILISPFLRVNDRLKELLEDRNRLKIDIRIVYGKNELHPEEIAWLRSLDYVRTSFCKNLHAKCYINEATCIVTSLNLYEFSQVNNNEMGVLIERDADPGLYRDAFEEAQRIIRISDEVRISMEKVVEESVSESVSNESSETVGEKKLSTSKLARKHKLNTQQMLEQLMSMGYLQNNGDQHSLTERGEKAGGEFREKSRFGPYFVWPESLEID